MPACRGVPHLCPRGPHSVRAPAHCSGRRRPALAWPSLAPPPDGLTTRDCDASHDLIRSGVDRALSAETRRYRCNPADRTRESSGPSPRRRRHIRTAPAAPLRGVGPWGRTRESAQHRNPCGRAPGDRADLAVIHPDGGAAAVAVQPGRGASPVPVPSWRRCGWVTGPGWHIDRRIAPAETPFRGSQRNDRTVIPVSFVHVDAHGHPSTTNSLAARSRVFAADRSTPPPRVCPSSHASPLPKHDRTGEDVSRLRRGAGYPSYAPLLVGARTIHLPPPDDTPPLGERRRDRRDRQAGHTRRDVSRETSPSGEDTSVSPTLTSGTKVALRQQQATESSHRPRLPAPRTGVSIDACRPRADPE